MQSNELPLDTFPALRGLGYPHGFVRRVPGIPVSENKELVIAELDHVHREARQNAGLIRRAFATAKQVHGSELALIDSALEEDTCFANCDGLVTDQKNVCLGVYVADCCALYLADRKQRAIALVHSGRKGTELEIAPRAIALLERRFRVEPSELVAQLSPCIRPPHYEVDFAAEIIRQCRAAGIEEVHDCGVCTACDLNDYYSYRAEKGRTGRMLAFLGLGEEPAHL